MLIFFSRRIASNGSRHARYVVVGSQSNRNCNHGLTDVCCGVADSISPPRPIHEAKLLALNTGLVVWASHVYYLASCPVGMSVFPSSFVDPPIASRTRPTTGAGDADCELRFGSWTLDSDNWDSWTWTFVINLDIGLWYQSACHELVFQIGILDPGLGLRIFCSKFSNFGTVYF